MTSSTTLPRASWCSRRTPRGHRCHRHFSVARAHRRDQCTRTGCLVLESVASPEQTVAGPDAMIATASPGVHPCRIAARSIGARRSQVHVLSAGVWTFVGSASKLERLNEEARCHIRPTLAARTVVATRFPIQQAACRLRPSHTMRHAIRIVQHAPCCMQHATGVQHAARRTMQHAADAQRLACNRGGCNR